MATSGSEYSGTDPCSLSRAVQVIGEKWAFFILREALAGATRFGQLRSALGIAPDVLSDRLERLTSAGVLERRPYQEPGQRPRDAYHLTQAGRELAMTIQALQQWGDDWTPSSTPTSVVFTDVDGRPVTAGFLDADGRAVDPDSVRAVRPV